MSTPQDWIIYLLEVPKLSATYSPSIMYSLSYPEVMVKQVYIYQLGLRTAYVQLQSIRVPTFISRIARF